MTSQKLSVLFVIAQNRKRTDSKAPLFCRITYQKKRKQFATGIFLNSKNWDNKNQKVKPPEENYKNLNSSLSLIKSKANQAFLFFQMQGEDFDVEDIFDQYKGKSKNKNIGIISHYNDFLKKHQQLIGIDIQQVTWSKFSYILTDLKDFIKSKYQKNDILLKDLDYSFIVEFEYYLKTQKLQKQVTINKALQRFKKVVRTAVVDKLIDSFPFAEHKRKKVVTTVVFLTPEELEKLENHSFSQKRLEQVRDMFVFCCYTGLAYTEMANLKSSNIIKGFDGNQWIQMLRQKTQKGFSIPLLPKAKFIIEKYQDNQSLLPVISNQKFNSYIKEVAEIIGIDKQLTHHIARKTFATTVLLYNDVPMEIVSELLGHSKISITQEHYAKVVQKKVSEQMSLLQKKLK